MPGRERWSRWCWRNFARRISPRMFRNCGGAAQEARDSDGRARRAIRHRGRIRRSARRHFSLGQAAGPGRYDEAVPVRARGRRRDQSGAGMVDGRRAQPQPHAALLCEPDRDGNPGGDRNSGRYLPQEISACRSAAAISSPAPGGARLCPSRRAPWRAGRRSRSGPSWSRHARRSSRCRLRALARARRCGGSSRPSRPA